MIILGLLPAACMSLPPSLWWALPLAVLPWVHSVDVHARLNANVCKVLPHISYTTYLLNPLYENYHPHIRHTCHQKKKTKSAVSRIVSVRFSLKLMKMYQNLQQHA
ncbi:hypothetical protein AB205_0163560 [Aquarana catesbeiana]|uniref:Secreted protein n=1 Tax=Aquarana catesbeiana TaxID=8400 RepID=A0A2G9RSZ8_AQUCT|nr:hypothetical protein AB205_0163560 [Aquarana catesbeiana]